MKVISIQPPSRERAESPDEPRIDWIVTSLFSSYGKQIHPEDKTLPGLLALTKRQVADLVDVLCGFTPNLDVQAGIRRWGAEFSRFVHVGKQAAA